MLKHAEEIYLLYMTHETLTWLLWKEEVKLCFKISWKISSEQP